MIPMSVATGARKKQNNQRSFQVFIKFVLPVTHQMSTQNFMTGYFILLSKKRYPADVYGCCVGLKCNVRKRKIFGVLNARKCTTIYPKIFQIKNKIKK